MDGGRNRGRGVVMAALDAPERAVAHDAVGDLQDARDLRERLGGAVKSSRW